MEKELNELLAVEAAEKTLSLNELFAVKSLPVEKPECGESFWIKDSDIDHMELSLIYVGENLSLALQGKTAESLMVEIPEKMEELLLKILEDLKKQFAAGHFRWSDKKKYDVSRYSFDAGDMPFM